MKKQSQKEEPGSNGSQSAIVEQEASQYALKTYESSSSSVTVVSVISASPIEAEVKIKLLNCNYDHTSKEQLAGQYLNRLHGKLARATNKVVARWVFDPGGTQPGRH